MSERQAEYHINNKEAEPELPQTRLTAERATAEMEREIWEKIITAIMTSPDWFANQINESQARTIVKAIKAKYPGLLHNK